MGFPLKIANQAADAAVKKQKNKKQPEKEPDEDDAPASKGKKPGFPPQAKKPFGKK